MMWEMVEISQIKPNPNNPRIIKDDKFKKLVRSIKEFPQMLELRPIVVNSEMVVLGGNMRLRACTEAGLRSVPIVRADKLTKAQQDEFIIKDNLGFGEWDWEVLANEWDHDKLNQWGLDVPKISEDEELDAYTKKIEAPTYQPKGDKPAITDLMDMTVHDALVAQINQTEGLSDEERMFLLMSAKRHIVFDYERIAEFYSHSRETLQKLMERHALVIIDFQSAIEHGYVRLSKQIQEQYQEEWGE